MKKPKEPVVYWLSLKIRSGASMTINGVPLVADFGIPGCAGAVYAFTSEEAARAFDDSAPLTTVRESPK